jgi:hypothetical protein
LLLSQFLYRSIACIKWSFVAGKAKKNFSRTRKTASVVPIFLMNCNIPFFPENISAGIFLVGLY